jgi:hypothetical protein
MELPMRAIERTLIELPILMESKTDIDDPSRENP